MKGFDFLKLGPLALLFTLYGLTCCEEKNSESTSGINEAAKLKSLKAQILSHFPQKKDTLVELSTDFLLRNLKYHYSIETQRTLDFLTAINQHSSDKHKLPLELKKITSSNLLPTYLRDTAQIKAEYLAHNIDLALKHYRKQRWKNDIPVQTFCNYVLPYRIANEPLSDWRTYMLNSYYKDHDSSIYNLPIQEAVENLHTWLYENKRAFKLRFGKNSLNIPDLPPAHLDKLSEGSCHELTLLAIGTLRSLGIPSSLDFTPMFLNHNNGHEWCAVILNDNDQITFDISAPTINHVDTFYRAAKIYRKSFMPGFSAHLMEKVAGRGLPDFFNDPCIEDVTSLYMSTGSITIDLKGADCENGQLCYLSVFTTDGWYPVTRGEMNDCKCIFNDLGTNGIYLPFIIRDSQHKYVSPPILLTRDGKAEKILPNSETETIQLKRKFPLNNWKKIFIERMVGGKFQGSIYPDFRNVVDLFTIDENPGERAHIVHISNEKKFRYLRYLSPDGSHGNIAELTFYEDSLGEHRLNGSVIGTEGSWLGDPLCTKEAAFDSDPLSYFDAQEADNVWVGLDLKTSRKIGAIKYLARTDLNAIQPGNTYELFYWNNSWKSLGIKQASGYELTYHNVPKRALLWLTNHSTGVEERIFTIRNGEQFWW